MRCRYRPMIIRPSTNHGVYLFNEFALRCVPIPLYQFSYCCSVSFDRLFAWRNDGLKSKWGAVAIGSSRMGFSHQELSDGPPKKINPHRSLVFMERLSDLRFTWLYFQPNVLYPRF